MTREELQAVAVRMFEDEVTAAIVRSMVRGVGPAEIAGVLLGEAQKVVEAAGGAMTVMQGGDVSGDGKN